MNKALTKPFRCLAGRFVRGLTLLKPTLALALALALTLPLRSQPVPPRPSPPRLVNDLAGIFTPEQVSSLERELVDFDDSTSNQIAVVTMKDLGGYDPMQMAFEIGQQWGVGSKEFNNGLVVLVKPKTPDSKGEVYIAVGYGLEPVITDAATSQILHEEMIPRFRQDDYYGGVYAAVSVLKKLATGEIKAPRKKDTEQGGKLGFILFIIVLVILISLFRGGKNKHHHIGKDMSFLTWLWLLSSMTGGGRSGGSSWGGGGGFGGGGGGGFGGFGGGGFGGGGAGGSW